MTTSTAATLANVVSAPPSGRSKAVVFDHHEYASSVILRGRPVPWDNATAYAAKFADGRTLIALINKDATQDLELALPGWRVAERLELGLDEYVPDAEERAWLRPRLASRPPLTSWSSSRRTTPQAT